MMTGGSGSPSVAYLLLLVALLFLRHRQACALSTPTRIQKSDTLLKMKPWYFDSDLNRDRTQAMKDPVQHATSKNSKYMLLKGNRGIFHATVHEESGSVVKPLFLNYDEIQSIFGDELVKEMIQDPSSCIDSVLAWVGKKDDSDYWALYVSPDSGVGEDVLQGITLQEKLTQVVHSRPTENDGTITTIHASPLREFGDALTSVQDAGILATANGLVEFHKSHGYCQHCGSRTVASKAGGARKCTSCDSSTYPRIDVAAIMLITSPCQQYALLGRKRAWPKGRYSTLAGFTEVGETLEHCCVRETLEESGVRVKPDSVKFVCSQPWPFPRSLMVGFRGQAEPDGDGLPVVHTNVDEMENVRWFHKDYVAARLDGGSTALGYEPNETEEEFHIPGRASLARILITQWATQE